MLTSLIWNSIGLPRAQPGDEPRWADRNPVLATGFKVCVLITIFLALTVLLSFTVFPEIEHLYYGNQILS